MADADQIPPSRAALAEALALSAEVLRNLELTELPLTNIAMKVGRLARLLNDFEVQRIVELEVAGYPPHPDGMPADLWHLAGVAGRHYKEKNKATGDVKEYCYRTSISELETQIQVGQAALAAAVDADVAVSSANPHQFVGAPSGNWRERSGIRSSVYTATGRLASRQAFLYQYVLARHYELKYSGIADDIFSRVREKVDAAIGNVVPDAVKRLTAVYENLRSENPEDWSNAVHSCRRILEDLADAVFPPSDEVRTKQIGNRTIEIKLGKDNFINRIVAFVEDHSSSARFSALVGSQLAFLGDRLDAVFKAAQKGTHDTIVNPDEANRYVVYTYLIVGDILSLSSPESSTTNAPAA